MQRNPWIDTAKQESSALRREEKPQAAEKENVLVVERRTDGRLWADTGGDAVPVSLVRCFPWTSPGRYLSLRNDEDVEVAFVADPAALDPDSQAVLEEALHAARFVLEVTAIEEIEEDVEIRRWRVCTRQGPRQFQTTLEQWPRPAPDGGLLVEDVAGDLFHVPPAAELDAKSRKLVWAFVD
jgi:hypothetical protein